MTVDRETEEHSVDKKPNPAVIADVKLVHKNVDPATTLIFINHDDERYPPDILLAEVATESATERNLNVATATKLITLAGHIKSATEKHKHIKTSPSFEPPCEGKVSHDNSHLLRTTAGADTVNEESKKLVEIPVMVSVDRVTKENTDISPTDHIEVEVAKSPVNIHSVTCASPPNESDIHVETKNSNIKSTTDGARSDLRTGNYHNNLLPGHGGHRSLKDIK